MVALIIILTAALLVTIYHIRRTGLEKIAYKRYFSQAGVFEGDTVMLVEEIQNRFFLPLWFVDVDAYLYGELRLPDFPRTGGMQEFTSRFFLAPYTQVKRSIPIECTKRGYYELDSVYVQNRSRAAKTKLFVYPRALPHQENNPLENQMQNTEQSNRRLLQDPFSFAGVREYRFGDPFKSINYKATAKTGALKVNERDFFSGRNIMLYIDFHTPHAATMEKSLSYAADMVDKAIKQGYNIGFAANCQKQLGRENHIRYPLRRGQEHYIEILREMAAIRISEGCSFAWLLQQDIDILWNAEIYLITENKTIDNIIAALQTKGNHVTLLKVDK
ncbi:MAG: DUF58 domain-containing protein [Defluviitaleaceae bacterium]|nr:DUF58 domain-containing protein [Defluviitaleaceae bacterium]